MLPGYAASRDGRVVLSQDSHSIPGVVSSGAWIETLLRFGPRLVRSLGFVIARLEEWQRMRPR